MGSHERADNGHESAESETPRPGAEPRRPQGPPFFMNEQLLRPGVRAPVPLLVNQKIGFQAVLRDLLIRNRVPPVLIEPAAVTGGAIVHGCQEFVAGCHDLISASEPGEANTAGHRILSGCRALSGNLEGAYVLVQVTETLEEEPGEPAEDEVGCSRLKNLSEHLEPVLSPADLRSRMDTGRLALLEVRLDEVYDLCCRQLERFYLAALRRHSPALLARFARELYRDLFKRIAPDHLFDPVRNAPAGGEERDGLLDLLPEFQDAIKPAGKP